MALTRGRTQHDIRVLYAVGGAIVVAALLLRLFRISDQELWFDEAFSFQVATLSNGLGYALRVENNPPLYYLLLRGWIVLTGSSEWSIRFLSAGFGTLFVAVVIWAGWRIFSPSVGLWSGLLAALSPIHIYYSQEARCYSLLTFLLGLYVVCLWDAWERDSWPSWLGTACVAALALYTHYLAIFALLPTVVLFWMNPRSERPFPRSHVIGAALLCALLFSPWVVWCFVLMSHAADLNAYTLVIWQRTPPSLALPKTFEVFALGHQAGFWPNMPKVYPALDFPAPLRYLGLASAVLLGLWAALPFGDHQSGMAGVTARKVWVWILLLIPLVSIWLLSFVRPIYLVGRYDLIAFPAYVLLMGFAFAKLQRVAHVGLVLVTIVSVGLFAPLGVKLVHYYQLAKSSQQVPSNRLAAEMLAPNIRSGDVFAYNLPRGIPALYYLHRLGFEWSRQDCRHAASGRRFTCRMIPPEDAQFLWEIHDPMPVESVARELALELGDPSNGIWTLLNPELLSNALFMTTLDQIGFVAVPGPPGAAEGLTQFRRY
jgi:uncharacterized membrane protein